MHLRAELLRKRFALLYAYNGTGKTRLSTEFKNLGKISRTEAAPSERDTLYFNAFTEDLFTWDNDLPNDRKRALKLNRESKFFAGLEELEMDNRIRPLLDRYADFEFRIDTEAGEVSFSRKQTAGTGEGDREETDDDIKISRGEQNIFIWCWFLVNLQLALDGAEAFGWVKYVYIDDPVSSLDEHNCIIVANHLVQLLRESDSQIPVAISTHHNLFFNVVHYELKSHFRNKSTQLVLSRDRATRQYGITRFGGDTPSFHHVAALQELIRVSEQGDVQTYHFNVLRTILEKTALFHGYTHFGKCINEGDNDPDGILHQRFVDLMSHGKYSLFEPVAMGDENKRYFRDILNSFLDNFPFNPEYFPREQPPTTIL